MQVSELRTVLAVGLGRSGITVARALADAGVAVIAADAQNPEVPSDLADRVDVQLGCDDEELVRLLDGVDLVVPSPGVPEHAVLLRAAARRGVPIWSEPELGFRLAPHRLVGVTGTNGKTTVTEMTAAMLRAAGLDAVACGNIGDPFTPAALSAGQETILVAELSSFQLRFASTLRPQVGVVLNIAEDHLDWHADMAAYAAAKAQIWQAQTADDWAVANVDDPIVVELARDHAPGRIAWTSIHGLPDVGVGVADGKFAARLPDHEGPLLAVDDLGLAAPHHVANTAAAACASLLTGATADAVIDVARRFRPGRHRLETVAEVRSVRWVNDSKATNPHAATAALHAVSGPVVWIAGGLAKGVDLTPLRGALGEVRHAVLIGEAAAALAEVVASDGIDSTSAGSIEEAVRIAAAIAEPGDTVLLAPACASFDQFRDYAERGDRFVSAVGELT